MQHRATKHLSLGKTASDLASPNRVTPEQRLLAAVLARAILDATGNDRVHPDPKWQRGAKSWLLHEKITDDEMSLGWICQHLGLCPLTLREIVKRMIKERAYMEFPFPALIENTITPLYDL